MHYYKQYWFGKMLATFSLKEDTTWRCNFCVADLKVHFCAYGIEEWVNMNSVVGKHSVLLCPDNDGAHTDII
jgi:hypothetical protein